jgi:RNA polymerase sigma-70 factor (ECF subfamily)
VESSDRKSNADQTAKKAVAGNADPDAADMDFEKLLVAARAGSADAAGELVARYRAYLLKIAGDHIAPELRQKMGVSDVVQESMLTAHCILDSFQGNSEAQWKAWLKTIVGNDIGDLQRRFRGAAKRDLRREMGAPNPHSSAPSFDIRRPGPGPRTEATMNEDSLRLNAALESLSAEYRQVIRLRNWEQLSYEDIGQRMGKSAEATRKLWTRAIKRLQEEIGTDER